MRSGDDAKRPFECVRAFHKFEWQTTSTVIYIYLSIIEFLYFDSIFLFLFKNWMDLSYIGDDDVRGCCCVFKHRIIVLCWLNLSLAVNDSHTMRCTTAFVHIFYSSMNVVLNAHTHTQAWSNRKTFLARKITWIRNQIDVSTKREWNRDTMINFVQCARIFFFLIFFSIMKRGRVP